MSAVNVGLTVSDPDLLIAGNSPFAPFVVASIKLYRYTTEALARADVSGSGGTVVTTFSIVPTTTERADPDIAGPFRYGYYDSGQLATSWYRYQFTNSGGGSTSALSEPWQGDNRDQWAVRDLIFEVGDLLGQSVIQGTASAGTTTTLTCTDVFKSSYRDALFYVGYYLAITRDAGGIGDAPEGEEVLIASVDTATGIATFDRAMTIAPASGDTFVISEYMKPSAMIRCFNRAREKMQIEQEMDIAVITKGNRFPAPAGVKSKKDVIRGFGVVQYANSDREDLEPVGVNVTSDGLRQWVECELFPSRANLLRLIVLRSYRDVEGAFSLMSDTTSCPVEWTRPAFAYTCVQELVRLDPDDTDYKALLADLQESALAASGIYAPDIQREAKSGYGRVLLPGPAQVS